MVILKRAENYVDDRGNRIIYPGVLDKNIEINFRGSNNTIILHENVNIARLNARFDCNNGILEIGSSKGVNAFKAGVLVGQDSTVKIGNNVSNFTAVYISAVEGCQVIIGDDCMLASQVEIRTDDAHPIFDVRTGKRSNPSKSIQIGNHVWLARRSVVLGGASIGDGSVLGFGSILTKKIPNNCIAVGSPAKVVKRDIIWERPHLSSREPFYKPDADSIEIKSPFWNLTDTTDLLDPNQLTANRPAPPSLLATKMRSLRAKAWRLRRRILAR